MQLPNLRYTVIGIIAILCLGVLYWPSHHGIEVAVVAKQATVRNVAPEAKKQAVPKQTEKPRPQVFMHTVKSGETLSAIARQYGTDVASITAANNMSDTDTLKLGQKLKVLNVKGVLHKVRQGESLWQIAHSYGTSVKKIMAANAIKDEAKVKPGQQLILPGAKPRAEVQLASAKHSRKTSYGKVTAFTGHLAMPVYGRMTSRFGYRWGRMHEGVDLAAPTGTPVHAAGSGVVTYAGWKNGYGKTVIISHGKGYTTLYGHNSSLLVSTGEHVNKGQLIAKVGSTGHSTGPHCHFEVHVNGRIVNPLRYIG